MSSTLKENNKTVETIINALSDKKAKEITILDLRNIDHAVCDYYIISHGTSDRHTQSLAENVMDELREQLHEKPWHVEGIKNKEWILLDYADVVVHVFQEKVRNFYDIEGLWADADKRVIEE